jgi:hypothetical protein
VHEGQRVRVARGAATGLVHQLADGEMGQQQTVEFLADQGASAASGDRRAASP